MRTKITTLLVCTILAVGAFKSFAKNTAVAASCDASNDKKCVIYNVGEGTGKLSSEEVE